MQKQNNERLQKVILQDRIWKKPNNDNAIRLKSILTVSNISLIAILFSGLVLALFQMACNTGKIVNIDANTQEIMAIFQESLRTAFMGILVVKVSHSECQKYFKDYTITESNDRAHGCGSIPWSA